MFQVSLTLTYANFTCGWSYPQGDVTQWFDFRLQFISIILPTYGIIREYLSKKNSFQCVGTNQTLQAYLQVLKKCNCGSTRASLTVWIIAYTGAKFLEHVIFLFRFSWHPKRASRIATIIDHSSFDDFDDKVSIQLLSRWERCGSIRNSSLLILQRQLSNEAPFYSDKLHVRGHFASLWLGLCLGNASETCVFFSEQVNKIATLFFYMPKDNEDNIFFAGQEHWKLA